MLAPFMLPETLIVAFVIRPVGLHVRQKVGFAKGLQDLGDVGVCTRTIAVGIIGAVAVIRPMSRLINDENDGRI